MTGVKKESGAVKLPKEKIKAERKSPKLFFIYGPEKVGKTTALSQLDECLILDLEEGSDFVDALKLKANSPVEMYEIGKEIQKQGLPYKYIAIDTLDKLEEWAEARALIEYKASVIGRNFDGKSVLELPQGGGYYWLRRSFFNMLDFLISLAPNVILVGHVREKSIEKKGKEVNASDINLTGKIKSMVAAKSDAIGYLYREDGKLMITFDTRDEIKCGSRCDHLRGQTFEFDWKKIMND